MDCGGVGENKSVVPIGAMMRLFMLVLLFAWRPAQAGPTLEIGIWPYMSTQALLTLYHPMQTYLAGRLQRSVLFVTARDQKTFVDRTQKGEYRFVVTAPHFARLAQKEAGYVPMLRPKRNLVGLLVVARDSPMRSLEDLRGKTITLPDRYSIVAMFTLWTLRVSGLEAGRDFNVRYAESHNNAVLDVLRGTSAAAAVAATILDQMPESEKDRVRVLVRTGEATPLVWIANPSVPREEISEMTRIILDFTEHTRDGAKFMKRVAWNGLEKPTGKDMESLDPYVADLKRMLEPER